MIDTLKSQKSKIKNQKSNILKKLNLKKKKYAVLTLHRPSNVDNKKILQNLFHAFALIQNKIKIIYPVHPRTRQKIKEFNLQKHIEILKNFILIPPINYLEMLKLIANSKLVMTDSGGIQEESTVLNIPCLTLRPITERPITVEIGTNILVNTSKKKIIKEVNKILKGKHKKGKLPKYWDGKTAQRIIKIIDQYELKK